MSFCELKKSARPAEASGAVVVSITPANTIAPEASTEDWPPPSPPVKS
jgi:hypothetical protein